MRGVHHRILASLVALLLAPISAVTDERPAVELTTNSKQIAFGPKHHFFGYIGHVQTIPWNQSGRYLVALPTDFQERKPNPDEAAGLVLLDTTDRYAARVVDRTRVELSARHD